MEYFPRPEAPECLKNVLAETWPLPKKCDQLIRLTLDQTSRKHCAYCDGVLHLTSLLTIDHFRPQATFPLLKSEWSNLFPCCTNCQAKKRAQFDDALLKPDELDYEFARYFSCNFSTGKLEENLLSSDVDKLRTKATIRILQLNDRAKCNQRLRERKAFLAQSVESIDDFNYRYFLR